MIQISPEQIIWTRVRMICVGLFGAERVYDYLPSDVASYPFVFIGEQFKQNYRSNKDKLNKSTQITIHVWHNNYRQRGTLTSMMRDIEQAIINEFGVNGEQINTQVLPDNTTNRPLMHGIIETDIYY